MEKSNNNINGNVDILLPSYETATSGNTENHTTFRVEKEGILRTSRNFINQTTGTKYKVKTKLLWNVLHENDRPIYKLRIETYGAHSIIWRIEKLNEKGFKYDHIEFKQCLSGIGLIFTLNLTTNGNIKKLEWQPIKEEFYSWILKDLGTDVVIMEYRYIDSKSDSLIQYYNLEQECLKIIILSLSAVAVNGKAFQDRIKAGFCQ